MSNKPVEIEIDHLVLHGIDPRHRARIAESVRDELVQLVASGGLPPHWMGGASSPHAIPRIEVDPGQSPARIGANVARAIYRGGT
jgi:beta-lactamase regulating signal transducer with metallopeptidase domain